MKDTVQYVEARGARFAVHGFGSGTPVLALHGGFRTGRVWIEVAEAAAIRNVRVLAPDARGHGLSAASPDPQVYSTPNWRPTRLGNARLAREAVSCGSTA